MADPVITAPLPGDHIPRVPVLTGTKVGVGATAWLDLTKKCTWVYIQIFLKAWTGGTGTADPSFKVEMSSSATGASDVRSVTPKVNTPQTDLAGLYLVGLSPDGPRQYIKITAAASGTDTFDYDYVISGIG